MNTNRDTTMDKLTDDEREMLCPAETINHRNMALDAWLDQYDARFVWSRDVHQPTNGLITDDTSVECYRIGRDIALVIRHRHGWDVFTSADRVSIAQTLADAELRTGLALPKMARGIGVERNSHASAEFSDGQERPVSMWQELGGGVRSRLHFTDDEAIALGLELLAKGLEGRGR